MKKTFIVLVAILCGCTGMVENDTDKLTRMKSPVILIGKSYGLSSSVTLLDSTGLVVSFYGTSTAMNLYSRNVGDTIK